MAFESTNNRNFRKAITVGTASAALANFQRKITVTYNSHMASDFSDLLFETSTGTNIPYWIETKTNSTSATVWVLIPTTSTSANQTIYMYYGAVGAVTSPSNIDTVMDAGLRFFYYTGMGFNNFIGTGIDTTPNYGWGSGAVTIAGIGGYSDNLSIIWQGWIKPNGLGTTTFYCTSDDGQRMYYSVNSDTGLTNIIDNWVDQGDTERSANVNLQAPVWFQYNFYENGGGATARIGWDSVNGGKEYPIPSTYTRCKKYLATEPSITFGSEEDKITVTTNYLKDRARNRWDFN